LVDPGVEQGWTPGDVPEEITWVQTEPDELVVRVYTPYPSVYGDAFRPYILTLEALDSLPTATGTAGTPQATPTNGTPPPTATPGGSTAIVVDHESVDLFLDIPDQYIDAASNLSMVFVDRSVGVNIDEGLTCLSYPSDRDAPSSCRRIDHSGGEQYEVDPSIIRWERADGYPRDNWEYRAWEGQDCGSWYGKLGCFIQMVEPDLLSLRVASFQMSYLAVDAGSSIADTPGGFFYDNPDRMDVYDLERFEAGYPDTVFIYWTSSLARAIGTTVAVDFNEAMRAYARDHAKPLFDVADILAHDPDGRPCYDNRDGVPYSTGNKSENHPDDGLDLPAICQQYTTEVEGGHLGSISAGKIRVAKGFWVLMAQLAGWEPAAAP
jgi:hypothetical protein